MMEWMEEIERKKRRKEGKKEEEIERRKREREGTKIKRSD